MPRRLQVGINVHERPAARPPLQQLTPLLLLHVPPLLPAAKPRQPRAQRVRLL